MLGKNAYNVNMNSTAVTPINRQIQIVQVLAPARLHLGFVSLESRDNSQLGALGLAIDRPCFSLEVSCAQKSPSMSERVLRYSSSVKKILDWNPDIDIQVREEIPAHVGLGSGTQLALSIATAVSLLSGTELTTEEWSMALGRGKRSGIGTGAFESGGFLVDQGATMNNCRSIAKRIEFPDDWRIVLVLDLEQQGIHGQRELDAFQALTDFPPELSAEMQALLKDGVLPALESKNLTEFGRYITLIQNKVGDFFSKIQGGRYSSRKVAEVLSCAANNGAAGIGQSSWGPTGFVIVENQSEAEMLVRLLRVMDSNKEVAYMICNPRNSGATVQVKYNDALQFRKLT